jgi:hypothetical protein
MRPPKRGFELQRPLLSPADLRMKGLVVRDADNPAIWVPHIHHRVTNVYRRTLGHWKLVHHHTDSSEARMDIVKDLTEIEKRTAER